MANLFKKAKSVAPKVSKAKDQKIRVTIEDPTFFDKISKLEVLQDNQKRDKAKADIISDELRDLGKSEWAKLYEKNSKNPGSFMLVQENEDGDTSQFMMVPTDGYIKLNEERAEELREEYGDEIVEEKTVFSFDSEMIEKYGEILSRLIEESDEIAEKDKEKIIKATTSYAIAKGTVDELKKYGDVLEMIEIVKPIVALKNVEVVKA